MTEKKTTVRRLTRWQRRALADLRAQARSQPSVLVVGSHTLMDNGICLVPISLSTAEIDTAPGGLQLRDREQFTVAVWPDEQLPPAVYVTHTRFLGQAHVLSGHTLCLYLDNAREWDPVVGINGKNGVLDRLWRWLTDAAIRNFNPDKALYHAIGGVPHLTPGTPLIVIRSLPNPRARAGAVYLTRRTDYRLDLHSTPTGRPESQHVPVVYTDTDMPFGAGRHYLAELLVLVNHPDLGQRRIIDYLFKPITPGTTTLTRSAIHRGSTYSCGLEGNQVGGIGDRDSAAHLGSSPAAALLVALAASASRKPDGTPQYLILAVPHPNGGSRHLLAIRLSATIADELRHIVRDRTTPLITFDLPRLNPRAPMEWCYVSDEREAVTTRRDTTRPITAFKGKSVVVWGCGGIGSWVAEYIARAGARRVILCDHGIVTGGLLVRQNYVENDIGHSKAHSLAQRLTEISDSLQVEVHTSFTHAEVEQLAQTVDAIIDATISRTVTRQLDTIAPGPNRTALIAQVATDTRTGSLGLLTVSTPGDLYTLTDTDKAVGRHIKADASLEPYHLFWEEPLPGDELTPTRGCSVPTFHGSAADLASVAAGLTSLIGQHLTTPATGTHLIALPHSGVTPAHTYVPRPPPAPGLAASA